MNNVNSVSEGVKSELYEKVAVSKLNYEAETRGMTEKERHKLTAMEMKCLWSMS